MGGKDSVSLTVDKQGLDEITGIDPASGTGGYTAATLAQMAGNQSTSLWSNPSQAQYSSQVSHLSSLSSHINSLSSHVNMYSGNAYSVYPTEPLTEEQVETAWFNSVGPGMKNDLTRSRLYLMKSGFSTKEAFTMPQSLVRKFTDRLLALEEGNTATELVYDRMDSND